MAWLYLTGGVHLLRGRVAVRIEIGGFRRTHFSGGDDESADESLGGSQTEQGPYRAAASLKIGRAHV